MTTNFIDSSSLVENSAAFSVIFMDLNMVKMHGYEATQRIREFYDREVGEREQPLIICVTGHDEEQFKQEARYAGMDLVISKPTNYQTLKYIMSSFFIIRD